MTRAKGDADALFDVPGEKPARGGALYQAVAKQVRTLADAGDLDLDRAAGLVGQARSIAAMIDYHSGRNHRGQVASGMQLGALHGQLLEVLRELAPTAAEGGDEWQEFTKAVRFPAPADPTA